MRLPHSTLWFRHRQVSLHKLAFDAPLLTFSVIFNISKRDQLEDLSRNRTISKWFKKQAQSCELFQCGVKHDKMAGYCKHGNELLGSIKSGKVFHWLWETISFSRRTVLHAVSQLYLVSSALISRPSSLLC